MAQSRWVASKRCSPSDETQSSVSLAADGTYTRQADESGGVGQAKLGASRKNGVVEAVGRDLKHSQQLVEAVK